MFITFEGIEGSGKTTQIKLLGDKLRQAGIPFISIREPGGTPVSEAVRDILLSLSSASMESETELLLFMASRCELVRKKILPAIKAGKVVICDRFIDSTTAYQGFGRGLSMDVIAGLNKFAINGLTVKRTYFLDYPVEVMLKRNMDKITDRIENEDIRFHRQVRDGFLYLCAKHPRRILKVDGSMSIEKVHKKIFDDFKKLYDKTRR